MKTYTYLTCLILLFAACGTPSHDPQTEEAVSEWKSLFNGHNLDGWIPKINGFEAGENYANTFRVEEGILKISYEDYDRYDTKFGALYYEEPFSNYRLKVEYRFVGDTATGAPSWGFRDSGIQYHGQSADAMGKDQNFPVALEYNLHGGDGTNDRPNGQICTIGTKILLQGKPNENFCTQPQVARTFHGDQWVTAEIEVNGDSISHWVNGEKILS